MTKFLQYFQGPLNSTLTGYICKVLTHMLNRKTNQVPLPNLVPQEDDRTPLKQEDLPISPLQPHGVPLSHRLHGAHVLDLKPNLHRVTLRLPLHPRQQDQRGPRERSTSFPT